MSQRLALLCALCPTLVAPAQTRLQTTTGAALVLDDARGRIAELRGADAQVLLTGGDLWSIGFRDGTSVDATEFLAKGGTVAVVAETGGSAMRFSSADLALTIHFSAVADRFEVAGEIERAPRDVTRLSVPAKLNFVPANCERLVFPQRGNTSLGIALTKSFFVKHTEGGKLVGKVIGPSGYASFFGAGLNQLEDNPAKVKVTVTEEGKKWFSASRAAAIERETLCVNRPSAVGQYTVLLVDSPNGPLLCGHDLGGKGLLLRLGSKTGGDQRERESAVQRSMVMAALESLAQKYPERFRQRDVVLLAPVGAPPFGSWTAASIPEWETSLRSAPFVARTGARVVVATSQEEGLAAVDANRTAVILNPFGETFPLGNTQTWQAAMGKVKDFVKAGGFWWEMGGYPFYRVFEPEPFREISVTYPSAVADFLYLQTADSGVAIYGQQPMPRKPWEGRENPAVRLHPALLSAGGEEAGGYLTHGWLWLLKAGESHRYPAVRLLPGVAVRPAIARYKQELGLDRSLADKVKPAEKLAKLKSAVLVRARAGNVDEHLAMLGQMPPGTLFHFSEYLHGGFDKQYPDHLPPRESYGTSGEFAELYRKGQEMGHLMMPYTNTSWWCFEPKGPTFERVGDGPLARNLDGKVYLEQYAANKGYAVCYWDPEVIAAHHRTRQELSVQYPSDVLFQDQVGARGFRWDINPAIPYATGDPEGLHSLSTEDSETVPVATEDGYDRVAQFETMLCGMAWGMIPTDGKRAAEHNRYKFVPGEWEFFPLMGYLAHENCLFTTHDLGHFITDAERQAYALAFGFGMSEACTLSGIQRGNAKAWLFWLDAVQKTVCTEYGGQPLLDFSYPLANQPGARTDVILTRYRGVTILANIGDQPLPVASIQAPESAAYAETSVAGPGFLAVGPRVQAGMLAQENAPAFAFAVRLADGTVQGGVLAQPGAPLPKGAPAAFLQRVAWQELGKQARTSANQAATPEGETGRSVTIPEAFAGKAPTAWGNRSRTIVVPVIEGAPDTWVEVKAKEWVECLRASLALRQAGFQIVPVTDVKAFTDLLRGTPDQRPFAIINPGGEFFYGDEPKGAAMLGHIADYVRQGGIWWETGGYSLYIYAHPGPDGQWLKENLGDRGAGALGFSCGSYDVDDPPRPLVVTEAGKQWLGSGWAAALQRLQSGVQRPFVGRPEALNLVMGGQDGFVAGIRADGWGWLWRLGGFRPNREAAQMAVVGVLERLATQPWPEPPRPEQKLFWNLH